MPHERMNPKGTRIELSELVKKYYKRKDEKIDYNEISGGFIDDAILDGEKQIARRLQVNLFEIKGRVCLIEVLVKFGLLDEMQDAKLRHDVAKDVLDRCNVNTRRHRNVKSLTKGGGILACTTYIN